MTEPMYQDVPVDPAQWLAGLGLQQTVGGEDCPPASTVDVPYPATEETIATAPFGDAATIAAAVLAAHSSFPAWSRTSWEQRREALERFAAALEADVTTLSLILTAETGRTLRRCRSEVLSAGHFVRTIAATGPDVEQIPHDRSSVRRIGRPLGVVGAIAPWNSPVLLAVVKVANALLSGNTLVLKASPFTPLAALRFGQLARSIFPAGVLNVVNGDGVAGAALVNDPRVAKISFTGSTATGKLIAASAARQLKRLTLELGGNDAAIVLADANLDTFVEFSSQIGLLNCGAFCAGVKRVYVERSIHDELVDRYAARLRDVVLGDAFEPATDMGPIQNRPQFERVLGLRNAAVESGATLHESVGPIPDRGLFLAPAAVTGLSRSHPLVQEEQFGPLLPIIAFDDPAEAVIEANSGPYGLGGSVWSADIERAESLAVQLDVGTAWVNQHGAFEPAVPMPFAKASGIGIDYGGLGVHEHSQPMVVNVLRP